MRRALNLLRLLAEHHEDGITLTEVLSASGLERSTAHRLLSSLVEERFAERDPDSKAYRLSIDEILDAKGSLVATRPSILPISDGSGIAMPGFGGATSGVLALVSEIFPFTGC